MLKKILLAYDGTEGAKLAANYTVELAKHYEDVEVTVLTIGGPLFGVAHPDGNAPRMHEQEYKRIADEGLALLANKGVLSHQHFRWLDPADEILREAEEGNYDLIVMGHRGANQSLLRDAGLLGSVAIKVINHALCSVLIVRPEMQMDRLDKLDTEEPTKETLSSALPVSK